MWPNPKVAAFSHRLSAVRAEAARSQAALIRLEDNPKIARIQEGLCNIGGGQAREYGCDMANIWFGRSAEGPGAVGTLLNQATTDTYDKVLRLFDLNKEQINYASESIQSPACASWASGPPGTGKSYTQMAILLALKAGTTRCETKRWTFLSVAHTNEGVDANMEKFCHLADSKQIGHEFEIVRFAGGSMPKASMHHYIADVINNADEDSRSDTNAALVVNNPAPVNTVPKGPHEDRSFYARLCHYILHWASDPDAVQHEYANAYLRSLERARGNPSRAEVQANLEIQQMLREAPQPPNGPSYAYQQTAPPRKEV